MTLKWRVYQETTYNEILMGNVSYWVGDAYDPEAPEGRQVIYSAMRRTSEEAHRAVTAYVNKKNCGEHS